MEVHYQLRLFLLLMLKDPFTGLSPLMAAVDNTASVNPINSATLTPQLT